MSGDREETFGYPHLIAADVVASLMGDHGPGFLEIRLLPSRRQAFFDLSDPGAIDDAVAFGHSIEDENVFFGIAPRVRSSGKDEDVEWLCALFADCDDDSALDALARFTLKPSILVHSGGLTERERPKTHSYWLLAEPAAPEVARDATKRIAAALGSDKSVHNPSRVARLPWARYHKDGSGRRARVAKCELGTRYALEEIVSCLPLLAPDASPSPDGAITGAIPEGARNATLASMAGALRRYGCGQDALEAALAAINLRQCNPPIDETEVLRIARSIARYPTVDGYPTDHRRWPKLEEAAFYGLAGEVVRAIEPHSEADPAALLMQFLAAFGNLAGRGSYFRVEDDVHPPGIYATIVGETSKARKGTSWGRIKALFRLAAPEWLKTCATTGAVSGEGLVWEVRDPEPGTVTKTDGKADALPAQLQSTSDRGVSDKRRLWLASEFASILKACSRDGSTLSAALRELWDSGDHRTAAKNSPARTTGAHTSLITHVTADELRRLLSETDAVNGFANRFLYVCARQSKLLPEPTQPDPAILKSLAQRVSDVAGLAHQGCELQRDEQAKQLWRAEYGRLSEGRPGLLGAITNRGEAQVVRLALTFALLDRAPAISSAHLRAAIAVWRYCFDSAAWIFGDSLGDRLADKLLSALRGRSDGLTRTEIRELVGNQVGAGRIDDALGLLERHSLATSITESTGGRAARRWTAVAEHGSVEETE